ncbi:MAG: hypothetical protein KGH75_00125 [Rhodospirillales bacterium]|nr:hypothetical protein [Rhodospirillales bacterium]
MVDDLLSGVSALAEEPPTRNTARTVLDERLLRPFDPEEQQEYDIDLWAQKNIAASAGLEDGRFAAQPVSR